MKKQFILAGGGLILLLSLFFFGKTVEKKPEIQTPATAQPSPSFSFDNYLQTAKQHLSLPQQTYVLALENNISRGDVQDQQLKDYSALASFWKDSVHDHTIYDFYIAKSAKLVKSEKTLTFAAQLMLTDLQREGDPDKKGWVAEQAIELFEQAIELDPNNDSLKVGLGSCYVYGKGMAGNAQETMKGIQQLLQVVRRDSTNMQAQLVLGIGGVISSQFDKAIPRLTTVVTNEPNNAEAVSWLADAYAGKGDKENAVKWYEISKRLVNNPNYSKEVDERIKMMQ
ncbi:tetratricopeptide repeat protein [Ferruginibacter albus]|uniref:tetratricopeptide repeat protein n=1 Tax=Ferruginibacter albus TaxID=2875540 RepID=UPI001CC70105|nr:tetratricopeptide repeat protein [Ferruginibacter albus]UAY51768.1 tetratricopeptide repeat protein [Ferruginibacter albus]